MAIKARLGGDSFDLDTLAKQFREGDPHVSADGEGYYLTSSVFDGLMHDGGKLKDVASSLLRQANGVARVRSPGFRPVRLTGRFSDDTGASHVVMADASIETRSHLSGTAVVVGQPAQPPGGPEDIHLAQKHSDVAEVLDILGKEGPSLDWLDLSNVYEIVRDHGAKPGSGKKDDLVTKGWVSEPDITAFIISAEHQARHARPRSKKPPRRIMTLSEAQQVIAQLVARWMDSL
jgi:hypothetical protein